MKNFNVHLVFLITPLLLVSSLIAQKPYHNTALEINPDKQEASEMISNMRVNTITGVPIAVYRPDYSVRKDTPERMALQYLAENSSLLKINPDLSDIKFLKTIETPGGYHIHFSQMKGTYSVYNSRITVSIDRSNKVYYVMNGYKVQYGEKSKPNLEQVSIPDETALNLAKNYLGVSNNTLLEKVETIVYYNEGKFRLAQQVKIIPTEELYGDWEVLIDAQTGEIFRAIDKAYYSNGKGGNPSLVDGTGYVFDPDPVTHARTVYGTPGFIDNNDEDSDSLTAHREFRTLLDITFEGGVYILKGPWAEIRDFSAPYTGLHTSSTNEFHYTRSHDSFEAVNVYYHFDRTMRWINDTLGISLMPYQYPGGVRFDPHALNGIDNSVYDMTLGSMLFGDGGVDDAEDMMIILHEFGHGIHDWITFGGMSQVDGLSEGCGDYWASSNNRSTGYWTPADSQYYWVYVWDGHNPYWTGRSTNYPAHYPEGLTGDIHTDGQMWSSSLMSIYDLIGRVPTDNNFIEALAMTNGSAGQFDAAVAFMIADQIIYGSSHLVQIIPVFVDRGYIDGPLTAYFTADVTGGQPPLTVHFSDLSVSYPNSITSWEWDFNNDGTIDSYDQNPTWVFTDYGAYTVTLSVSDGTNTDTETKADYILVNGGILVWEGEENGANYSGTFIRNYLQSLNYPVVYSSSTNLPTSLSGYNAIFLSFGNYGTQGTNTIFDADKAASVFNYLRNGGNVYLEGGDAFGYDQVSNTELLNLFGLSTALDGSATNTPITNLQGQPNTLTNSMLFTSSSQLNNNYIDKYIPNSNGQLTFFEPTVGNVAVLCSDTTFHQKTFCFSYALGRLDNQTFPSTKENLIDSILAFFNVPPVPVELLSFNATLSEGSVKLKWETATELNNKGFEIQRKTEKTDWERLGFVEGQGTTTEKHNYGFTDPHLPIAKLFYRLKQVDFDGSYNYSKEVFIDFINPVEFSLEQNYPNPFNPTTTIGFGIQNKSNVKITILNAIGEEIALIFNEEREPGFHQIEFNAANLPSGVYFYQLKAGDFIETRKMILLK